MILSIADREKKKILKLGHGDSLYVTHYIGMLDNRCDGKQ